MALSPQEAALLWSHLNVLTKDRYDAILEVFGSLEDAAKHVDETLLRGLGCREDTIRTVLLRLDEYDNGTAARELALSGCRLISLTDAEYPRHLREIGDPPVFLYVRGDLSILAHPCIALVGTRQMSPYGRRVAQEFTSAFIGAGMVTVSGLASGIDSAVAEESLRLGGKTVAVLGHGLGMIYPASNEKLARRIVDGGGLLMSEFFLSMEPGKFTFPARNRVIAALCAATVVLEAPEDSGAIITADLAFDYSRDVFAVPGQIFDERYAGCHRLISTGRARLAASPGDVLRELGVVAPLASVSDYDPKSEDESKLLAALSGMPQPVDDLVEKTGIDPGRVAAALTMMELGGGARNMGAGQWVRG